MCFVMKFFYSKKKPAAYSARNLTFFNIRLLKRSDYSAGYLFSSPLKTTKLSGYGTRNMYFISFSSNCASFLIGTGTVLSTYYKNPV